LSSKRQSRSSLSSGFATLGQQFSLSQAATPAPPGTQATEGQPYGTPPPPPRYGAQPGTQFYGAPSAPPYGGMPPGGMGYGIPGATIPPVSDAPPLTMNGVLDKVGLLTGIAVIGAAIGWFLPIGVVIPAVFVAFAFAIVGRFRPRAARVVGPLYAITEGLALGGISNLYNTQSHGIVPLAIAGTAAVFIGTLLAYRTGLVRVSNRFITFTAIAGFVVIVVMLLSVFGLHFPGFSNSPMEQWVIFGPIVLLFAIARLLVDFEFVARASRAGISADGEWYAALLVMLALVLVYLSVLRMLGGVRR